MGGKVWVARAAVALVVAAAIGVYAVTDNELLASTCYVGVLVGAGAGAWIGAARTPSARRLVPRLIAVGIVLTALGDAIWTVLDLRGAATEVSMADPPWFASYVFLCAAVWVVLRRSQHGKRLDLDFAIDIATIVVVSVLVFWSLSIDAIVGDETVTPFVRAVWASYPIADAVLLALLARVLMSRSARAAIGIPFAVGVCLWLAADMAFLQAPGGGLLMDAAWMIAPVLMAAAAWRAGDIEPDVSGSRFNGWVPQIAIAVLPLLVPPALELTADLRGLPDQPLQLFLGTAALVTLALVRTARLLRSEERANRELEVARDAALEASRAKSMFLTNMSHELRTPLTTMLATAELLEDTQLDDVQLHLLAKMHRSGDLLKGLVESVLDFARIEARQLQLDSKAFDLHAMVADAADVYRSRSVQTGIRFEYRLHPGVPRRVVGDAGRLFQVLANLLDNALKFTHEGHVVLSVSPASADPDVPDMTGAVEFVVTDTGIGIGEEDQAAIFETFHQVDGSITRRYGGNGLGLAICKELTELMGGTISVHSRLGVGSTFTVCVPLGLPAAEHHTNVPSQGMPLSR